MKRIPITIMLMAVLALSGCASLQAAYQNMTPAQKAKYTINGVYVIASEGIKTARLFMDNEDDLDILQAKLIEIRAQIESTANVILALIPPGMDEVSEYAQEKIDALSTSVDDLQGDFPHAAELL